MDERSQSIDRHRAGRLSRLVHDRVPGVVCRAQPSVCPETMREWSTSDCRRNIRRSEESSIYMLTIYRGRYHTTTWQKTALQRISVNNNNSTSLLLQHLPRRALHPQLGVAPVQELEMRRQRHRILPLSRRIDKHALQMKRRGIRLLIRANLHSKQPITRPRLLQRGRVTASHNNLSHN
jgi:hypothetical protein